MDRFDVFLFDSFGVLNVGDMPIPGAANRIDALRRAGKRVKVLTNAASGSITSLPCKYGRLGFGFNSDEIVSSREVLALSLAQPSLAGWYWAAAAAHDAQVGEIAETCRQFVLHRPRRQALQPCEHQWCKGHDQVERKQDDW